MGNIQIPVAPILENPVNEAYNIVRYPKVKNIFLLRAASISKLQDFLKRAQLLDDNGIWIGTSTIIIYSTCTVTEQFWSNISEQGLCQGCQFIAMTLSDRIMYQIGSWIICFTQEIFEIKSNNLEIYKYEFTPFVIISTNNIHADNLFPNSFFAFNIFNNDQIALIP